MKTRCEWCGDTKIYQDYHDKEWGVPLHGDQPLFEMLTLEGAQAGLSWITILKKRDGYRRAFANFDIKTVAAFTDEDRVRLLADEGIVRNRLKVDSTITNAQAVIKLWDEGTTLTDFVWSFVDGTPIQNSFKSLREIPAKTEISDQMSKALKKKGFRFVGSTICYAFMQAVGMVNDHVVDCWRYEDVK